MSIEEVIDNSSQKFEGGANSSFPSQNEQMQEESSMAGAENQSISDCKLPQRKGSFARKKREQMRNRIKNSLFSGSKNNSLTCSSTENTFEHHSNSTQAFVSSPSNQQNNLLQVESVSQNQIFSLEKLVNESSLNVSSEIVNEAAPVTSQTLDGNEVCQEPKKGVFIRFSQFENQDEIEKEKQQGIFRIEGNFSDFYELQETLGEGCVGLVKRAVRKSDQKVFAVKTVRTRDEETIQNIKFEFTHLKRLSHQNIVKVYELYVDNVNGKIHSVMELIQGKEMFEVIHQLGHYTELVASRIFSQILDAIAYMHKHYCCHRDLKPNNILCNKDGTEVKITDFNVSKFCDHYKNYQGEDGILHHEPIKMWTYTGTMAFSAPEVFNGEMYDESIDMWSAGCILYTMLSGREPFQAEYVKDLVNSICQGRYEFSDPVWNEISSDAKDLIAKCLTVDSSLRINPADALNHPFITQCKQNNDQDLSQNPNGISSINSQDQFNENKKSKLCRRQLNSNIERLVVNNLIKCSNANRPRAVSSIVLQQSKRLKGRQISNQVQHKEQITEDAIHECNQLSTKRKKKYSIIFSKQDLFCDLNDTNQMNGNLNIDEKMEFKVSEFKQINNEQTNDRNFFIMTINEQQQILEKQNVQINLNGQQESKQQLFNADLIKQFKVETDNTAKNNIGKKPNQSFKQRLIFSSIKSKHIQNISQLYRSYSCDLQSYYEYSEYVQS